MADTFQLEVVTPEKILVKDSAEEMQLPGKNGYLGILPGHAPLITELAIGKMTYHNASGENKTLALAWGFAEVLPDKVTVLAELAELPEEIDVKRAREAKERAEKRLASNDTEVDVKRAQDALARADCRLQVAEGSSSTSGK